MERLLDWGSVAIETTYNQPILPYAILALNATEHDVDPKMWDVQTSTRTLLDSLADTVNKNVVFSTYADLWRKRGKKIDTVDDLMKCYYSALRVGYVVLTFAFLANMLLLLGDPLADQRETQARRSASPKALSRH